MTPTAGARAAVTLDQRFEPLVAVMRDGVPESIHRGAVVWADVTGRVCGGVGDPTLPIHLRSTAKPFQALAVVESGAADAFALTSEELAVMCGSHAGQREHVRVVGGLLERVGAPPAKLVCGSLAHMCSGKHAGMTVQALHLGAPVEGYERVDHPVQQRVAGVIAGLLGRERAAAASAAPPPEALFAGRDGCGVPVIRLRLDEAARLYALLAAGATPGLVRVRDAMLAHPELVAGRSRLDTKVMKALPGAVVAKGGAEGVQALAVVGQVARPEEGAYQPGIALGCVFKIANGSTRPVPPLVQACLHAAGLAVDAEELAETLPRDEWSSRSLAAGEVVLLIDDGRLSVAREGCAPASHGSEITFGGSDKVRLKVARGNEADVVRFLYREWPLSDEETFGPDTIWCALPFALVLKERRRVLGVLRGHFLGGVASVDEFIVGHDYRGRGAGEQMLLRFEQEARAQGCTRVVLRAVKGSRAECFYRRLGYETQCTEFDHEFGNDFVRLAHAIQPLEVTE